MKNCASNITLREQEHLQYHLEGVEVGPCISVYKIEPAWMNAWTGWCSDSGQRRLG
jgi:hypothetical protein